MTVLVTFHTLYYISSLNENDSNFKLLLCENNQMKMIVFPKLLPQPGLILEDKPLYRIP